METIKKILKILPWVLLIIAVTAIVAELRYIDIEKENIENYNKSLVESIDELQAQAVDLQKEVDNLQKEANELQKEADDLQGKANFYQEQLDEYANKPNEWQGVVDGLSNQLKQIYIADQDALDALAKDLFMRASEKIAKNDYSTFPEFPVYGYDPEDTPLEITEKGFKYELRDTWVFFWTRDEYEDVFVDEMCDKVFNKRFLTKETEHHIYLYVKELKDDIPEWGVVNAELKRVSKTENEIKYSVKYDRQENGKITNKGLTCTMTIKYEEGRYRISDTNFGNL
ncbi:MAG: hypothetical protein J1E05_06260 [Eubacterium sp.]|nr:hypothetical protein [Eubacterium sp.]